MKKGLNAAQLKLIAIIAMVFDHTAELITCTTIELWYLAVAMKAIGRLTMPIMCFFVAEGFHHTKDVKKYLWRMAIFAVISQLPFYLNHMSEPPAGVFDFIKSNLTHINVIGTLFMGLLALSAAKSEKLNIVLKVIACAGCIWLTRCSDWRLYGVMWVLAFGLLRGDFKKQAIAFVIIAFVRVVRMDDIVTQLLQFAVVLALPLLALYNGEKGRQSKYGFYIFYPAHLLVLWMISLFI